MTQIILPNQNITGANLWSQVEDNDKAIRDVVNGDLGADNIQAGLLPPTGSLMPYAGSTAPTGWLLCDGSPVSQTTYDDLYAVISTTYNTGGEGAGNFRLPNLKGKTIVGRDSADSDFDTLAETRGTKTETLTSAQIPAHSHTVSSEGSHSHSASTSTNGSHTHSIGYIDTGAGGGAVSSYLRTNTSFTTSSGVGAAGDHSHSVTVNPAGAHTHTVGSTGGDGSHNNIQPSIVLNYIIKT